VVFAWRGTSDFKSYVVGPKFAADNVRIGTYIRGLPEGTIAAVGIGAIAYASERPILDLVGLADKHIARSRRVAGAAIGHDHVDNDYVLARAPRYVIMFAWLSDQAMTTEDELRNLNGDPTMWMSAISLLRDPRFLARYSPNTYRLGTQYMRLWQLNDGLAPR
jgi:hypothetical protein